MIHRVRNCFGVPLWKSRSHYLELWFCFCDVPPHRHPGQESRIIPLFGWSRFFRQSRSEPAMQFEWIRVTPRRWFHGFTVAAGAWHWFTGTPLIFLNWSSGTSCSASENFAT